MPKESQSGHHISRSRSFRQLDTTYHEDWEQSWNLLKAICSLKHLAASSAPKQQKLGRDMSTYYKC